MKKTATNSLKLSWEEIAVIAQGFTLTSRVLKGATASITKDYRLGPRGAWILRMIETGRVIYPLDVTNFFHISRSVITEELAVLAQRRLIVYRKSKQDGRRVKLVLTRLGKKLSVRVQKELTRMITERLSAYSRSEVLQFARMLQTFVFYSGEENARGAQGEIQ